MSAHPRRRPRERAASGDPAVRLVPQVCAPVLGTNLGEGKSEALLRAPSVPSLALSTLIRSLRSQSPETHNGGSCSTSNPRGLKLAQVSPDFDGFSVNLCASVVRWAIIRCLLFDGPGLWKACGQHQHAPGSAVSEDAADLTLKCGGTAAELCAKFAGKRSQTSVVCRREKL